MENRMILKPADLDLHCFHLSLYLVHTGPCIHRMGINHRIGPKIGLFLCLTDCFFFTRMMCIKDYVFSAICMHLNILILI